MSLRALALALVLPAAVSCTSQPGPPQAGRPDPTVYPGHLSNAMDCNTLTPVQRQFVNLQRYGCGEIPNPASQ